MAVYAVNYFYAAPEEELAMVRPTHRAWLVEQLDAGKLLASGPLVDRSGALLIVKGESLAEVAALLDQDPFDIAGFIGERDIVEWNPVFGPWSNG